MPHGLIYTQLEQYLLPLKPQTFLLITCFHNFKHLSNLLLFEGNAAKSLY